MQEKYLIYIKADTNDADYVSSLNEITKEDLEYIKPLIEKIKNFKPYTVIVDKINWTHNHNYPFGNSCRNDLDEKSVEELYCDNNISDYGIYIFEELLPNSVMEDIHTIKSIIIYPFSEGEKLL